MVGRTRSRLCFALVSMSFALLMGMSFTHAENRAQEPPAAKAVSAVDIGNRLELFVDNYLIEKLSGQAALKLHRPTPQEVVFTCDRPWEGNTCAYFTVFRDGDLFRMYYRGSHHEGKTATHEEVACYAESEDGIHWRRPNLGLFEWNGARENNIIWTGPGAHNFTPFKDSNPKAGRDARYKALAGARGGLLALKSADAVHWSLMAEKPVITKGAFDSQNLAFWDAALGKYRDYHRIFRDGVRDIATCTSDDFLSWTEPVPLRYPGATKEHLYTNAIRPYERAAHLLLGFPTRFLAKTQQTEPVFMSSRDGLTFHRWSDPVIPITAPKDRDGNRSNYLAWGLLELPGRKKELSVYGTEAYYAGPAGRLRPTSITDGLSNTLCAAEVKAFTSYVRNTSDPGPVVPTSTAQIATMSAGGQLKLGPALNDNTGHTEWPDGRVHHSGFTTIFTPNTVVPFTTGGITYDIDYNSRQEGNSATIPTYAAITSRSYHTGGVVNVAMMDGSVRALSKGILLTTWRALGTRAGGEVIGTDF